MVDKKIVDFWRYSQIFKIVRSRSYIYFFARSLHHASNWFFFHDELWTGISLNLTGVSMWNFIQFFKNYQLITLSEKVVNRILGKFFFNALRKGDRSLHHVPYITLQTCVWFEMTEKLNKTTSLLILKMQQRNLSDKWQVWTHSYWFCKAFDWAFKSTTNFHAYIF